MRLLFLILISAPLHQTKEEGYIYRRPTIGANFGEGNDDDLGQFSPAVVPAFGQNQVDHEGDRPEGGGGDGRVKREDVYVSTSLGQLKGKILTSREGQKYAAFMGIPYAEKTERFEVATPVKPWNGVRDASNYGQVCPQFRGWNGVGTEIIGDEDCLYLNVFFPHSERCLDESRKLAVLFHIHGGAFVEGSGEKFGPDYFMDECIVFVSINYRLGALGFITTDDGRIPGNLGLKDQLLALKWTNEHIENFRGDRNLITIMGISAGGASVSYLIASPAAAGLFSQGIAGSGSGLNPWSIVRNPGERARELGKLLGCKNTKSTLALKECFKSQDFRDFITTQERYKVWNTDPHSISPVIEPSTSLFDDNYQPFQTQDPYIRLRDGDFNRVPLITGFVNEEGIILKAGQVIQNRTAVAELNSDWDKVAPVAFYYDRLNRRRRNDVSKQIRNFYFHNESISQKNFEDFAHLHSDRNLNTGILKMADLHSKFAPVYSYVFNYTGRLSFANILLGYEKPVVSHADDMLYLYRILELPDHERGSEEEKFSKNFIKLWTNFAKQGRPLTQDWTPGVDWKEYTVEEPSYLVLDKELDTLDRNYLADRRRFWDHAQLSLDEFPPAGPRQQRHSRRLRGNYVF